MTIRGERRKSEVLITVDGSPLEWSVIAQIEADRWVLDAGDVLGWLESAAGTNDVVRLAMEES